MHRRYEKLRWFTVDASEEQKLVASMWGSKSGDECESGQNSHQGNKGWVNGGQGDGVGQRLELSR